MSGFTWIMLPVSLNCPAYILSLSRSRKRSMLLKNRSIYSRCSGPYFSNLQSKQQTWQLWQPCIFQGYSLLVSHCISDSYAHILCESLQGWKVWSLSWWAYSCHIALLSDALWIVPLFHPQQLHNTADTALGTQSGSAQWWVSTWTSRSGSSAAGAWSLSLKCRFLTIKKNLSLVMNLV